MFIIIILNDVYQIHSRSNRDPRIRIFRHELAQELDDDERQYDDEVPGAKKAQLS